MKGMLVGSSCIVSATFRVQVEPTEKYRNPRKNKIHVFFMFVECTYDHDENMWTEIYCVKEMCLIKNYS